MGSALATSLPQFEFSKTHFLRKALSLGRKGQGFLPQPHGPCYRVDTETGVGQGCGRCSLYFQQQSVSYQGGQERDAQARDTGATHSPIGETI